MVEKELADSYCGNCNCQLTERSPLPVCSSLEDCWSTDYCIAEVSRTYMATCIVSCIRYRYAFYSLTDPTCKLLFPENFVTLTSSRGYIFSSVIQNVMEANVSILCVYLTASQPIFAFLTPNKLVSLVDENFTRSFKTTGSKKQTAIESIADKNNRSSEVHLPPNGNAFELQYKPELWRDKDTKTLYTTSNDSRMA